MTEEKEEKADVPALLTGGSTGFQIANLEDLQRVAKLFIYSALFAEKQPTAQEIAKVCVKIMAGQEMGLNPYQAMRAIDVVNGNITYRYQFVGAKIKQSGRYDFRPIESSNQRAIIAFYDRGEQVYISEFNIADAEKAGLAKKDNYQKNPSDMLYARALTKGCSKVCPELFFGPAYSSEEFGGSSAIIETEEDAWNPAEEAESLEEDFAEALVNPRA